MSIKYTLAAVLSVATLSLCGSSATAQQLVLEVNRETGALTLMGDDAADVNLAGYQVTSTSGTLVTGNISGLTALFPPTPVDPADFPGQTNLPDFLGWQFFGAQSANQAAELNNNFNETLAINDTTSFEISSGGGYNPTDAILAAGFGVDVEPGDLAINFGTVTGDTSTFGAGVVQFVGEQTFNNIGITIDLNDGTAFIENESPFTQTITGFLLESAGGNLSTDEAAFTGLGGTFEAQSVFSGSSIGQLDQAAAALGSGGQELTQSIGFGDEGSQQFELGTVLADGVDAGTITDGDISFSFLLEGEDEVQQAGFVKFILPEASTTGDFNGDGFVNAADFTNFRDNFFGVEGTQLSGNGNNDGLIDEFDFPLFEDNFGGGVAGAASSTSPAVAAVVPEPTAALLVSLGVVMGSLKRRSRNEA